MGTAPASAREALDMVRAGLGYLAAADAAQLPPRPRPSACASWSRHDAVATAARAGILAAFTAGQGYAEDADYSAVSWLIHRTGITNGAAVGHTAWAKRTATHPRVLAALAAGQVSEPVGRLICLWTGKLPEQYRDDVRRGSAGGRCCGAGAGGAGRAVRADVRAGPRRPARSGPGPGLRGPRREAGHHVRRRRGDPRGPDRRSARRWSAGCWTRCPPRPGRRTTGPRISGTTTRWPRRCANCENAS